MGRGRALLATAIVIALFAALAASTAAALPGNGRVAVISGQFTYGVLFLVEADGSSATQLSDQPVQGGVEWSPDLQRIGFTGHDEEFLDAYFMNSDGSGLTRITRDGESAFFGWSPDGSKMLLSGIRIADGDGTNIRFLVDGFPGGWFPDGQRILYTSSTQEVWTIDSDGTNAEQLTPPFGYALDLSPDGSKILVQRGGDVWTMNADGTDQRNLTASAASERPLSWSPSGDRILVRGEGVPPDNINRNLYSMKADGTDVRPPAIGTDGVWSPDGTRVAFTRYDPFTEDLSAWVVNSDGTGESLIRDTIDYDIVTAWEPVPVLNRPPDCSTVTAATELAKKSNLISVTLQGATDADGDAVALRITGVTQDEPLTGPGDQTPIDAFAGATPDAVRVRNEAGTKGDGRVYRISFEGDDGRGGTCSGTVKVSAPRRGVAIDSAPPSYDSFGS